MGQPAARLGDMHTCPLWNGHTPHVGGPILPACKPKVLIGGRPAARVGDAAYCNAPPDVITQGSARVFIGGQMAARMGDRTAHGGVIVVGDPTVLIGDGGGGIAAPSAASARGAANMAAANEAHRERAIRSKSAFRGQQKNKDTCALMSTQSVLLDRDGAAPPEGWSDKGSMLLSHVPSPAELWSSATGNPDLIDIASASGAYIPCNGTSDIAKVMTALGVPASRTDKPTLGALAAALDQGKAVIVGYDTRPVWRGPDTGKWPPEPELHAVRVTGVQRNANGTVNGFYINDSGSGQADNFVDSATFQTALDGFNGGQAAISDTSIQPPIAMPVSNTLQ